MPRRRSEATRRGRTPASLLSSWTCAAAGSPLERAALPFDFPARLSFVFDSFPAKPAVYGIYSINGRCIEIGHTGNLANAIMHLRINPRHRIYRHRPWEVAYEYANPDPRERQLRARFLTGELSPYYAE